MLTANQEKWLQALESDEFKQTKGCLEDDIGFCCLGVACIIAEREGVPVKRPTPSPSYPTHYLCGSTLSSQMRVMEWLGLLSGGGCVESEMYTFVPREKSRSLVNLNDRGKSFKEIAQAVRANPEDYFVAPKPSDRVASEEPAISGV